ncbi:hypothetical protein F4561_005810 [Lipingzhangella halophila]|uniref:poly(ethylene terephthalate) hydrolase n=1 Tax=Lipingzhangella halophila TaxID=1783352 RepID=A0A7W7RNW4_9ACTN|nr:alpha/beta hydrolase [Lipingzhangella halophila]MBB4934916.1 hypothetical protein [Lipingzhangella halophila]
MRLRRLASRICTVALGLVAAGALVPATAGVAHAQTGGTGPYTAEYTTEWDLRDHTIYRPQTLPDDEQLPIVVWGNGACRADGTWFENILTEFASHGFLVIANGEPGGSGSTDADMLTEAIDWAVDENDQSWSEYSGHLDTDNIAVMGQSCGGIEAYEAAADDRVTATALWNSGLLSPFDQDLLDDLHTPIAYFTGGEGDIAHGNAEDDWDDIPQDLPAFFASLDVGHYGTFEEPNGGEYGRVGSEWLKWQLKGDDTARSEFVGSDCGLCNSEWEDVQQRNLG